MEKNNTTKELMRLYNSIIVMNDNKERVLRIRDLVSISNFCIKVGYISKEEYNDLFKDLDITKYKHYVNKDLEKTRNELIENRETLINMFGQVLRTIYKCNTHQDKPINVDENKVMVTIEDFFKWLDPELYKEFIRMANEKNILYTRIKHCGGLTVNAEGVLNTSYILVDRHQEEMYYNVALVHEMGHAWGNKVSKNNHFFFAKDIFCEFPSILFEELYRRYLRENHLFLKEIKDENKQALKVRYISTIKARFALICTKLKKAEYRNLKVIPSQSIKTLNELSRNIDGLIIRDKNNIDLYECMYVLGFIFASYFVDRIFENKEEGLKEVKDFICRTKYDSLENILKDYPTILHHTKENIIKAYYNDFEYRNGYTKRKRIK